MYMYLGEYLAFYGSLFFVLLSFVFLFLFDAFVEWLKRREEREEGEKYDNK